MQRLIGSVALSGLLGLAIAPSVLLAQVWATPSDSAPKQRQRESIVLGVVRSEDNADQWDTIVDRLETIGIPYQAVDLDDLDDDLAGVTVLFLPNIETISSGQVITLGSWLNDGGRLIAAGPVGEQSSYGVRQALQSFLGAYWASPLNRASTLDLSDDRNHPWITQGINTDAVQGGMIVPSGLTSETLATWETTVDLAVIDPSGEISRRNSNYSVAAAIIATERTTFLGWEWGSDAASAEFDSSWLRATLSRFGDLEADPSPIAVVPLLPADPEPQLPSQPQRSTPLSRDRLIELLTPETEVSEPESTPSSTPDTSRPALLLPPRPAILSTAPTFDPAEQVAPPGMEVEISNLPISAFESIAMRDELENLIGRFESALLAANSANSAPSLGVQTAEANASGDYLIAATDPQIEIAQSEIAMTTQAAERARQILEDFPGLVEQRDYETARRQWLEARQMLWDNLPTDRPLAQPEIRAVWFDRGTIVRAGSKERLAVVFDQLADAGINTVFFETVNAGYPIYPSEVAPEQNPLTRTWDPLEAAVELAHERDMELHAWVWTFAAGNTRHNDLVRLPSDYLGPLLDANPDWANYTNDGRIIPPGQTKPFLDPANPEVRSYLLRLYDEIISNYDVDGLQLDYIRYPFQDPSANRTYGYGAAARTQFERMTGVDPVNLSTSDRELWQQWTDFRVEQINSFVAQVADLLNDHDPDLILSTAVFAMSEHERVQKIQQNWEVWAREGDVDLIVTMSYAMDTNRLHRLTDPWLLSNDLGTTLILPAIRLLDLSDAATFDQIQALRDMPTEGYALFAAENLDTPLQDMLSRTQGNNRDRSTDPIPYRDPFGAAAKRYEALLREWSFLLANNQLYMSEPRYSEWREEAEALAEELNQLASDPSTQSFSQAQASLSQFQTQFSDWMQLQSWNDDYRVQTWEYRLETINDLLEYGDRQVLQSQNS